MDRRLFIIHSADVIRRGLHAILRPSLPCEIVLLQSLVELNRYEGLSLESPLIIMEHTDHNAEKLKEFFKEEISFIYVPVVNPNTAKRPQKAISIDDSSVEICSIIKSEWESIKDENKSLNDEELTQRERDVLEQIALGYSNKIIADKLHISIHTVISHRKNITEKLGIKSISGLTVYAIINNIIDTTNINADNLI